MKFRRRLEKIYWIMHDVYKYIMVHHKFGKVGRKSDIRKPLRILGGKRIQIGNRCFIMDGIRIEAIQAWGGGNILQRL